ncbi:MAG: type IV toxin-antitoxin system AbiEi family antitoxin [Curtobacterium sp.]
MPITEKALLQALRRALPPGSIDIVSHDGAAPVAVLPDGAEVSLVFRWAGAGFPRDVARAFGNEPLSPTEDARTRAQHEVVFAQSVSDGSRRVIEAAGASWVALDGSASLHIGTVWVERAPIPGLVAEELGFRWSAARADVAEALFAIVVDGVRWEDGRTRVPEVESLARLSDRSLGSVSNALRGFDQNGWTGPGPEPRSRVLIDGSGMLDSWSEWSCRQPRNWISFHTLDRDPARVERVLLTSFGPDLVLTGAAGSERIRPFLTGARSVRAYVVDADDDQIRDLAERAGMLPAPTGQVRVAVAPRAIANTTRIASGVRIASPARIYADLLTGSEREREAAEMIRDSALGNLT